MSRKVGAGVVAPLVVERLWVACTNKSSVSFIIDLFPILKSNEVISISLKAKQTFCEISSSPSSPKCDLGIAIVPTANNGCAGSVANALPIALVFLIDAPTSSSRSPTSIVYENLFLAVSPEIHVDRVSPSDSFFISESLHIEIRRSVLKPNVTPFIFRYSAQFFRPYETRPSVVYAFGGLYIFGVGRSDESKKSKDNRRVAF